VAAPCLQHALCVDSRHRFAVHIDDDAPGTFRADKVQHVADCGTGLGTEPDRDERFLDVSATRCIVTEDEYGFISRWRGGGGVRAHPTASTNGGQWAGRACSCPLVGDPADIRSPAPAHAIVAVRPRSSAAGRGLGGAQARMRPSAVPSVRARRLLPHRPREHRN
jgi:hypothetical protein